VMLLPCLHLLTCFV